MKRAVFLNLLVLVCVAATGFAFGQSQTVKSCPFNIAGLWRSDAATNMTRLFFSFSPEGHVTLMGYAPNTLPQDFEMVTSVLYKLDRPAAPKEIEFTAMRGDDVFPKGVTSWKVVRFDDNSFTTLDPVSGQQTRWVREQTHRYFLTFAARNELPSRSGPAFAMWTAMDGRETKTDVLGIVMIKDEAGKMVPMFGQVSADLYEKIIEESERDKKNKKQGETVLARFELSEAEFEKTHLVYETWENYLKSQKLPYSDPYQNELEFLSSALDGFNQCGERVKTRPTQRERDDIVAKFNPSQQPLEYIKITRKKNEELHVTNSMYPWVWRPLIQEPGQ